MDAARAGIALLFLAWFSTAAVADDTLLISVSRALILTDSATHKPVLSLTLTPDSATALADFTAANVGRRVDIIFDGEVMLSPIIREPIRTGNIAVNGGDEHEYRDIAAHIVPGSSTLTLELRD